MKKSFMSISLLVVSISMLVLFLFSSFVHAENPSRFIYDKSENTEIVYTLDVTGKLLIPKLKYEFSKGADKSSKVKVAFAWSQETESWNPYYKLTVCESGRSTVTEYAVWEEDSNSFTANLQKVVYTQGFDNELLSYVSYNWNPKAENWVVNRYLLLEEYLAMGASKMN